MDSDKWNCTHTWSEFMEVLPSSTSHGESYTQAWTYAVARLFYSIICMWHRCIDIYLIIVSYTATQTLSKFMLWLYLFPIADTSVVFREPSMASQLGHRRSIRGLVSTLGTLNAIASSSFHLNYSMFYLRFACCLYVFAYEYHTEFQLRRLFKLSLLARGACAKNVLHSVVLISPGFTLYILQVSCVCSCELLIGWLIYPDTQWCRDSETHRCAHMWFVVIQALPNRALRWSDIFRRAVTCTPD
jgi:hypothetical protein